MLACYFPVAYTPPAARGTDKVLSREELSSSLEETLTVTPAFAPYVVPMLLEKLASSVRYVVQNLCD